MAFKSLVRETAAESRLAFEDCRTTLRCSGRRPEGPAAEPFLNLRADLTTWKLVKERGAASEVGRSPMGLWEAGCFSFMILTVGG